MRIKLKFDGGGKVLPSHNQHMVNGFIHNCLGEDNKYHDAKNTYSVSMLMGGKLKSHGELIYNDTASIIASGDNQFISNIITGAMQIGSFNSMRLLNVEMIKEEFFNGINHFATLSPILLKRYSDKKNSKFVTIKDSDYEIFLQNQVHQKIIAMLPDEDVSNVRIIVCNKGSKTKLVDLNGIKNIANVHHLSIECNKRIAELLYTVGIGQSTGAGFGTIYKTGNKHLYFD